MKELIFIRHGASLYAGTRYIGKTDTPLVPCGHEQANWLAEQLSEQQIDCVFTSPAQRARETVQPFLALQEVACIVDAELQEVDFGTWEGLSFEEIQRQSPEMVHAWAENRMDFGFPGGERLDDFWARVGRVATTLTAAPGERLAIVTHGGVIRYLLCHFLGLAPERHRMFHIDLGSITTVTLQDGFAVLKGLNLHG